MSYFYIMDLNTHKEYKITRKRSFQRITEGIYETSIERFYGLYESLTDEMKKDFNARYGFYATDEDGSIAVFIRGNDSNYYYKAMTEKELNAYLVPDKDEYFDELFNAGPSSNNAADVMVWLCELSEFEHQNRDYGELANNPIIRSWMEDFYTYIHSHDHNAARAKYWLDGGIFDSLLFDLSGENINPELVEGLKYDASEGDAEAIKLLERRRLIQEYFLNPKSKVSHGKSLSNDKKKHSFFPRFKLKIRGKRAR